MNLHEYQAKELLKRYNVPVQEGIACSTVAEAEEVIRDGYAKVQARLLLIPPRFPEQRETLESEILAAINDLATLEVHHEQP